MTDMRATERLLEQCEQIADYLARTDDAVGSLHHAALVDNLRELRRRGDTLVRRDDLRLIMETLDAYQRSDTRDHKGEGEHLERLSASERRLEIALGGKLR